MSVVAVLAGLVIVLAILVDIGLTVLHPTIRGPVSHRLNRETWRLARALARPTGARCVLVFAGPLTTATMLVSWLAGLWVGFALIYLPFVAGFSSSVHWSHAGVFAALYASATMLTTLGIGDLLPTQGGMRVAVACEAGAGVALVSAAISYLLSVYPLATQTRAHALRLSDLHLRSPVAAAQFLAATGHGGLASLHEQLIDSHQSLRRFPVLYYFHPEAERESVKRLLESAVVLCVVARWATPRRDDRYEQTVAEALEATLTRIRIDYERKYVMGRTGQSPGHEVQAGPAQLPATLASLRAAVGDGESGADVEQRQLEAFASFVAPMERFLAGLARAHLYEHRPLLARLDERRRDGADPSP